MRRLHPKTVEAIAERVCGDGTDDYRPAAAITTFLQQVDPYFPEHDGLTSRRKWVLQLLNECNQSPDEEYDRLDRTSLERVILQLADPREYQGDYDRVQGVLASLNRLLATEGLMVTLEGAKPQMQQTQDHIASSHTLGAQYMIPDFSKLTSDKVIANSLKLRWEEAQRTLPANAHLATVLLLGSILEGVLLVVIQANPADANRSSKSPKDANGKPKLFRDWSLNDYIEVACDCRWLEGDRLRFTHALRESRNLIHPMLQTKVGEWPNEHSCRICWEVVNAAIADLLRHVADNKTST